MGRSLPVDPKLLSYRRTLRRCTGSLLATILRYMTRKKDGTLSALPTNHNSRFAPVIHPTMQTGVRALVVAAHAWLAS